MLDAPILTVAVTLIVNRWIIQPLNTRLTQVMAQLNDARQIAERLAQIDPLTGVLNRREFSDRFEREWRKAERTNSPLSLLMLDLDYFKRVNDTHGHLAGDAALKTIAQVIRSTCRDYDDVGRYGGEEFCILLADTPITHAVNFAERLRAIVAETVVLHDKRSLTMTVSIGVAQLGPHAPDMTKLFETADQALFEAKRAGRNRVQAMTGPSGTVEQTPSRELALA